MATENTWQGPVDSSRPGTAADAVLAVLRARGIAVPDSVRQRIQSEDDPAIVERWLETSAVATSLEEVLERPS